jgi:hypothetical protein
MGYNSNSDEDWFFEYTVGQMTGGGVGPYGELGNGVHQQQKKQQEMYQEERRKRENEKRQEQRLDQHVSPGPSVGPAVETSSTDPVIDQVQEEDWSTAFAIIGMLVGGGFVYNQVDANVGVAVLAAIFAGYLCGRFYHLLVVGGVLLFLLWLFGAGA